MCGISGIIGKTSEDVIQKMLVTQKHRGPDDSSFVMDNDFAFGHNRLSIIDLTTDANQPFVDVSNRYVMVFNGEIYNYIELKKEIGTAYRFRTQSDTEVLLAAYILYGKACLDKLNGMFSFAIWDKKEKKIFAARDRFGVKPFYYATQNNQFLFASEIKTLQAAGISKQINEKVWANYFCSGTYGMPDETFIKDVYQLAGGHFLTYENNQLTVQKWYHFEKEVAKQPKNISFEEAKSTYLELLKDSISLRFRADVPIGFNISGGLDSSLLLALVNNYEKNKGINAFTFYTNNEQYDEIFWVEQMIAATKNPLQKVLLTSQEVPAFTNSLSHFHDEPFSGMPTLAYAKIFEKAKQMGIKVLLDGQGLDEQWAGYDYYTQQNNNVIQGITQSPFKKNVLSKNFINLSEPEIYDKPFENEMQNKQYRDMFYTKIPRALRFNDRNSMAFSTELREPFLDFRLVEFAFAMPNDFKVKNNITKHLVREIAKEFVGNNIATAPKRPLQTPQREWLAKDLQPFVEQSIQKIINSDYANWFDIKELKKEIEQFNKGKNDSSFHIWQYISLAEMIGI